MNDNTDKLRQKAVDDGVFSKSVYTLFLEQNLQRMVDEVKRLQLAVEAAFEEGFDCGYEGAQFIDSPSHVESWEQSKAKKDAGEPQ